VVCRVAPVISNQGVTLLAPAVENVWLDLRLLASDGDTCATCMPHFLLTFGDTSRPPVGAVIIEAPSMFQARMTAVVRRLAPGVPFGECLKLSAGTRTAIPPQEIGKMMSGVEAAELILRQAMQAKVLTGGEKHPVAINVARLRGLPDGNG
jgi:hypothetical protein